MKVRSSYSWDDQKVIEDADAIENLMYNYGDGGQLESLATELIKVKAVVKDIFLTLTDDQKLRILKSYERAE